MHWLTHICTVAFLCVNICMYFCLSVFNSQIYRVHISHWNNDSRYFTAYYYPDGPFPRTFLGNIQEVRPLMGLVHWHSTSVSCPCARFFSTFVCDHIYFYIDKTYLRKPVNMIRPKKMKRLLYMILPLATKGTLQVVYIL